MLRGLRSTRRVGWGVWVSGLLRLTFLGWTEDDPCRGNQRDGKEGHAKVSRERARLVIRDTGHGGGKRARARGGTSWPGRKKGIASELAPSWWTVSTCARGGILASEMRDEGLRESRFICWNGYERQEVDVARR
jgi:hypothetical protein